MKPGTLLAPAGLGRRNHSYCTWLTPYAKAGRCIICNERLEYLHSEFSKDRPTKCVAENFSRRGMGKKKLLNKNGRFRGQGIYQPSSFWRPTLTCVCVLGSGADSRQMLTAFLLPTG